MGARRHRLRPWVMGLLLAVPMAAAIAQSAPADAKLERKVEQTLERKPTLKDVDAQVDNGVATLTGKVPAPPDRNTAGKLAASVDGVKDVDNKVMLDPDLTVRLESALNEVKNKLIRLIANLPLLLVALLLVAAAVWLGGVVSRHLHILKRISNRNPYMDGLLRGIVQSLIVLGGVLVALDLLGATSLVGAVLGSAGVVGLVMGFAFKDIAENYIAGILLSIRRPFNPGDMVRIDNHEGRVVSLNSRATQLMTAEGNHLQLPNSLVFKAVLLNYSRNPKRRFDFTTNVAVGQSWHDAMEIGTQVIGDIDGVLTDPAPSALIRELADGSATLQFFGWIDQTRNDLQKTRSEAMRMVRRTLRERDIVPPDGVQRVVVSQAADDDDGTIPNLEPVGKRDTSVDRTLEKQVDDARRDGDDGKDLLDTASAGQPPSK